MRRQPDTSHLAPANTPTGVTDRRVLIALAALGWAVLTSVFIAAQGSVPSGSPEKARAYYAEATAAIETIFEYLDLQGRS